MLQADRQQTLQLTGKACSVAVQGGDFNFPRAIDGFIKARYGKATLVVIAQFRVDYDYLGIDKHLWITLVL